MPRPVVPPPPKGLSLLLAVLLHVALVGILWAATVVTGVDPPGDDVIEVGTPPDWKVRWPSAVHAPDAGGRDPRRPHGPKTGLVTPREEMPAPAAAESPAAQPTAAEPGVAFEDPTGPASGDAFGGDSGGPAGEPGGDGIGDGIGGPGTGSGPGGGEPVTSEPIVVRGDMIPPELVSRVEPDYPSRLQIICPRGTVVLKCVIGTDGRVRVREVLKSVPALDAAAIEAVEQWRYEPALWNGRPQAVFQVVRIEFKSGR